MPEAMNPITNPQLVEALQLLHQEKTPVNQGRVLEQVATKATFLAPVVLQEPPAVPEGQKAPPPAIQFQLVTNKEGQAFFPAFTDLAEMKKFVGDTECKTLVLKFDNYVAMLAKESKALGMVVNPMGLSLTLDRDTVQKLAQKKQELARAYSEQQMEKDAQVMVGDPVVIPQEMIEAVSAMAAQRSDIQRLWLRQMVRPDGVQSYIIVVEHTGEQSEVFQAVAEVARTQPAKLPVDMIPFGTGFADAATEGAAPFFTQSV